MPKTLGPNWNYNEGSGTFSHPEHGAITVKQSGKTWDVHHNGKKLGSFLQPMGAIGAAQKHAKGLAQPTVLKNEALQKGKNQKEQKKAIFGTRAMPAAGSPMRAKHMEQIVNYFKTRYNQDLVPSGGKINPKTGERRDEAPEVGVDKPDWRSGQWEAQSNPDAQVHEGAHLEIMPEGTDLPGGQTLMDKQYADVQRDYGYMKQKQSQHEVQPMAVENKLRRRMGLPANRSGNKVSVDAPPRMALEGGPAAVRVATGEGKAVDLLRQARLLSESNKKRIDQVDRGELKWHPTHGWHMADSPDAIINQRARVKAEDPAYQGKDKDTLMRSELEKAAPKGKLLGSDSSKDGITKGISKFYHGANISLHPNSDGTHDVHNSKGKIDGVHVKEHKGRWRFETKDDKSSLEKAAVGPSISTKPVIRNRVTTTSPKYIQEPQVFDGRSIEYKGTVDKSRNKIKTSDEEVGMKKSDPSTKLPGVLLDKNQEQERLAKFKEILSKCSSMKKAQPAPAPAPAAPSKPAMPAMPKMQGPKLPKPAGPAPLKMNELEKARIDSKLSLQGKLARRKQNIAPMGGNFSPESKQQGVHLPSEGIGGNAKRQEWGSKISEKYLGTSDVGQVVRHHGAPAAQRSLFGLGGTKRLPQHKFAIRDHQEKLAELRSMPKPDLPKSEGELEKAGRSQERKEIGVNNAYVTGGTSQAGHSVRQAGKYNHPGMKHQANLKAKFIHELNIENARKMPKPDLPKSEGELEKAVGGSINSKRSEHAKLKGVHTSGGFSGLEEKGQSQAGRNIERSKEPQPNKYLSDLYAGRGKQMHEDKLAELKAMPKPKLTKSWNEVMPALKKSLMGKPGINRPLHSRGINETVSVSNDKEAQEKSLQGAKVRRGDLSGAKQVAKEVTKELKDQPKPKLTKDEQKKKPYHVSNQGKVFQTKQHLDAYLDDHEEDLMPDRPEIKAKPSVGVPSKTAAPEPKEDRFHDDVPMGGGSGLKPKLTKDEPKKSFNKPVVNQFPMANYNRQVGMTPGKDAIVVNFKDQVMDMGKLHVPPAKQVMIHVDKDMNPTHATWDGVPADLNHSLKHALRMTPEQIKYAFGSPKQPQRTQDQIAADMGRQKGGSGTGNYTGD